MIATTFENASYPTPTIYASNLLTEPRVGLKEKKREKGFIPLLLWQATLYHEGLYVDHHRQRD